VPVLLRRGNSGFGYVWLYVLAKFKTKSQTSFRQIERLNTVADVPFNPIWRGKGHVLTIEVKVDGYLAFTNTDV
jgi:hypothetical protein